MTPKKRSIEEGASRQLALQIAQIALDKKGEAITVLDVRQISQFAHYLVLINGQVEQHLKAIANHISDTLKEDGIRPHHTEGLDNLQWILIDYLNVLVNIFMPEVRHFYDLEALWGEGEKVELPFVTGD
ncbi:ribosome silencing factor [candidate division LCP-89 bacterium B3_LCP]|uniref:Ribosomal silencing factor RsfS n=1 Tax=candidate division LCP-89 bacterium B3_LCP TaxID=2012998 RepID=A0A532UXZ7_UNCL8|nr:MAG: ribosome silencing factor [candidate division LCP-89 bacterium B3_LCP]